MSVTKGSDGEFVIDPPSNDGRWRLRLQDLPPAAQGSADHHLASQMAEVFENALNLAMAKNAGYGNAWQEQGWMGNLARILSKTARLKNMVWRDKGVESDTEPLEETVGDLINLSVFFLINRRELNKWGRGPRG
jgi:hypothetical protein